MEHPRATRADEAWASGASIQFPSRLTQLARTFLHVRAFGAEHRGRVLPGGPVALFGCSSVRFAYPRVDAGSIWVGARAASGSQSRPPVVHRMRHSRTKDRRRGTTRARGVHPISYDSRSGAEFSVLALASDRQARSPGLALFGSGCRDGGPLGTVGKSRVRREASCCCVRLIHSSRVHLLDLLWLKKHSDLQSQRSRRLDARVPPRSTDATWSSSSATSSGTAAWYLAPRRGILGQVVG